MINNIAFYQLLLVVCLVQTFSEDDRHKYLLLRQINYDFANNYEEHLDHASKDQFFESEAKSLQFKKRYSEYLLNLPTSESLFNPNGHFAAENKLGYNPLLRQNINNIFGNSKYIDNVSKTPEVYLNADDISPQQMNINPDKSESVRGLTKNLQESTLIDSSAMTLSSDGLPSAAGQSNQVRYAMATNSLENGLGHIRKNILDLENMINEYNKISDSTNNPQYLINLQQKISNSIEVIKLNSNSLKQYAASVTSSNQTTDINVERIDNNLNEILIEDSKLETIEKRFIENAQLPNNPYTLIDDDKMEEIFDKEVLPVANAVPVNATGNDNDENENDVNDDENEEVNELDPTVAGESENNNPLGPPDGNSADDGTPLLI